MKPESGAVLIAVLFMLISLIGTILVCAFPLAKEADDEIRHRITMQRIKGKEITDPQGIGWKKWHYDPDKKYWAGYRGERYLAPNSFDSDGNPQFVDGWGNPFKVILSG
jgi:hypothetical protein